MLYTNGNDVVRYNVPLLYTEVEKITDFIGSQKHMQRLIYFLSLLVRKVALILIWIFLTETLFREQLKSL
jgi:hypothetical protein